MAQQRQSALASEDCLKSEVWFSGDDAYPLFTLIGENPGNIIIDHKNN